MKAVLLLLTLAYATVALLFGVAALVVMGLALLDLWQAVAPQEGRSVTARAATAMPGKRGGAGSEQQAGTTGSSESSSNDPRLAE